MGTKTPSSRLALYCSNHIKERVSKAIKLAGLQSLVFLDIAGVMRTTPLETLNILLGLLNFPLKKERSWNLMEETRAGVGETKAKQKKVTRHNGKHNATGYLNPNGMPE